MHYPIEFAVIGDFLFVAFALHQMKGKGCDSTRDEGDCVPDGGVSKSGLFSDILSREGLGTNQIPERTIPGLWIGEREGTNQIFSNSSKNGQFIRLQNKKAELPELSSALGDGNKFLLSIEGATLYLDIRINRKRQKTQRKNLTKWKI